MTNKITNDILDYSNQKLTEFPIITKPNLIVQISLNNNQIVNLPNLTNFSSLRILDISRNRFVDLSPISGITSLRVLNCSENRIVSLSFVSSLVNLEVLNASHNRISTVAAQMPENLRDVDLSYNEIASLDFLQHKFPATIEKLDLSSNLVTEVISLRVIAVFTHLMSLNVGLYENNRGIQLLPYVKFLCPSLILFDGIEVPDEISENFPNPEILLDVLVRGNESELRNLIQDVESKIRWDEPEFIPFDEQIPYSPVAILESKVRDLEQKVPLIKKRMQSYSPSKKAVVQQMLQDINELKEQIAVLSNMIFVHDQAVKRLMNH